MQIDWTPVLSALIGGLFPLIGVIISNHTSNRKVQFNFEKQAAVTDEKINELTREVRHHNNFAQRMPVVEEQIKVINHRIGDLERNERK